MTKCKTTRKWVASNYTCVSVGYCSLQYLLRYQNASYYTCGVYGWNFDVFTFDDYAITTGYRGMISHVKGLDYETTEAYEKKAEKICNDFSIPYEDKKRKVNFLLKEYLEKVFGHVIPDYCFM